MMHAPALSRPQLPVARSLVTHTPNFIAITAFVLTVTSMFTTLIAAPAGFGAITRAYGETASLIGAVLYAIAMVALLFTLAAVAVRGRVEPSR